ncbi:MAG: lytic murein transglycosylase [Candidatus Vogelbacteria bacterium]|jgi:hypothetical protein|nr:lytic murein transglycosylase [Candidatus Vogelbacteria bacterium]
MILNLKNQTCLFSLLVGLLLFGIYTPANAQLTPERKAQLEAQLVQVEKDIAANQSLLSSKQKEASSISRDIDILTYKINQAKLNIKAKQLEIQRLGGDINKKSQVITSLSQKIDAEKLSLAELLRKTRELDRASVTEVVLGNNNVSDIFADLDSFNFVQETMHQSFAAIRNNQNQTTKEKVGLEKKRDAELDAKQVIEQEKRNIEQAEKEKQRLLSVSKSEAKVYQSVLASKEAERASIRSALFNLRDSGQIQFGQALEYANVASKGTGVRAAFILAIITQESNLGQNVGTCNRPGDPESKNYKNVMHPTRDIAPFLAITKELGIDPSTQPVSCPFGGGYGGAMGPSQFIPSTWIMYKDKIGAITGNKPPSPWNARDAFTATSLLVRDLGAATQNYSDERRAALRYYAGGNWANPKNAFYGNSVMQIATKYQAQINVLQGS